jgi:tetratricopeptide (TPR) repeat protein
MEQGNKHFNQFEFAIAENNYRSAIKENPRSVEARVGLARIELLKEHYEQGLRFINEALEIQPSNAEALALKGVSFMQKREWESAVSFLEKARHADPKLEFIYVNLATSYRELDRLKEAEKAARKAIEINPDNFQAHSELGHILVKTGKIKAGMKEMNIAVRINPLFIQGYLVLAHFYAISGKIEYAIQVCKKALMLNPAAIILREMLAGYYAVKGDFEKSYMVTVYIALERNEERDWLSVGNLAIATGRFERAEEAYQKVLQIDPHGWDAHYNLGELYLTAKLYDKAKQQYALAIEKDGASYKPFNGMGLFLLNIERNPEEAKKCFERALEIAPHQKEPRQNMELALVSIGKQN